ncbi:MAG: hypothetical protein HDT29_05830 [Clostridiales bacterium]|nr:hypothetical protein [Clostridiales bacterium]
MQFIFIIPAIIVIVAILNVAKEAKKEKAKKDAEAAMRKFDEKEELKKFVEPKPSVSASQKSAPTLSTASNNTSAEKSAQARLATRLQQLQKLESEIQSMGHHDDEHCAVKHEPTGSYRVEKVPVMNSIGGKSTEGCADHYDVRYVKVDEKVEQSRELTDLQKLIVYGDIINQPAFKRNYRR